MLNFKVFPLEMVIFYVQKGLFGQILSFKKSLSWNAYSGG